MRKLFWMFLVMSFLSGATSAAQSLPPTELAHAMYCITHNNGGWLAKPFSTRKQWPVSAAHDRMGYPHEDRIIVAVYETPTRGQLFDLTIWPKQGKRIFKIQNNGSFDLEKGRIEFVNAPSGDVWTQARPEVWAREAMRQQHFMLRAASLNAVSRQVRCTSYLTDK
jgi:hypothetical protein